MPSATYKLIRSAMERKQQITCLYQGYTREICPHSIGLGKANEEKTLGFQFAGGSSKGLPVGGQWRCMDVNGMFDVRARDGDWHSGGFHTRPQTCVKLIDLEVID